MSTNKQELRQTAEKAQEHGVFNMDIHSETVLALLDELEGENNANLNLMDAIVAKDKHIADLEATVAHANAGWKEAQEQEARAEAAERRLDELEAREVALPAPGCTYADHSYPAYTKKQVIDLLAAAGITVKGE